MSTRMRCGEPTIQILGHGYLLHQNAPPRTSKFTVDGNSGCPPALCYVCTAHNHLEESMATYAL
jgi:hypothetical protein